MSKVLTVRLDEETYQTLTLVARVERVPASQIIREAIDAHLAKRKADPAFRAKGAGLLARDQARLAALA